MPESPGAEVGLRGRDGRAFPLPVGLSGFCLWWGIVPYVPCRAALVLASVFSFPPDKVGSKNPTKTKRSQAQVGRLRGDCLGSHAVLELVEIGPEAIKRMFT